MARYRWARFENSINNTLAAGGLQLAYRDARILRTVTNC